LGTKIQVQWRRAKVLEQSSEGYTQVEMANQLQVDEPTISRDVAFLRQEAQDNLERHIHEVVPEEYQKCMVDMKRNLKQTLEIAVTVSDPKTKLQARAMANDCYRYIMDLCTNAGIVSDALKLIERKKEQIDTLKRLDKRIEESEEEKTTNGVF
jgi:DNA-binding transcriptional regulator LsrR (DeoR family)